MAAAADGKINVETNALVCVLDLDIYIFVMKVWGCSD